jgi:leucyl-tRNA synthetase
MSNNIDVRKESLHILLKTLSPIAPHLCHHLWQELGHKTAIVNEPWPSVDENALVQNKVRIINEQQDYLLIIFCIF